MGCIEIRVMGEPPLIALLPTILAGSLIAQPIDDNQCEITWIVAEEERDVATVLENVKTLTKRIGGLVQVYHGRYGELRVMRCQYVDDSGRKVTTGALSNSFRVSVVTTTGLPHLQQRNVAGETTCVELLSLAANDDRLGRVLATVGNEPLGWFGVYEIIEAIDHREERFAERFKKCGVKIDKDYVRDLRRIANHYRHQGKSDKNSLPSRKISLMEAQQFLVKLIQAWLESSRGQLGNMRKLEVPRVSEITVAIVDRPKPSR